MPRRLYHVINSGRKGAFIVAESRREAQRIFLATGRVRTIDAAWARDVTERYEATLPDVVPELLENHTGIVELPVQIEGGAVRGTVTAAN